jgi:hypothetical protein
VGRGDSSDSFFYSWSEASVSATEWLRLGVVVQRTRARESDREVESGVLAGTSSGRFDAAAYVFFPSEGGTTFVASLSFRFR